MKTKILFAVVAIATSISFSGCLKKGEDDPFVSLKSRKARVAGDWKVTSLTYTTTYTNSGVTSTEIMTMNGSTYTLTETDPSGTTTTTGTWTIENTFDKDGTYKSTDTEDGDVTSSTGTWNFSGGVGELKNKSQITMYELSSTSTGNSNTWTGNYVDQAYDLKELKNKMMVWHYKSTSSSSSNSSSSYETEIVFEPK